MPESNPLIGWPQFDPQVGDVVRRSPGFMLPNEDGVVVDRQERRIKVEFDDRFEEFELTDNNAFWRQDNPSVPGIVRAIAVPIGGIPVDKRNDK